jgi:hypothetical protein
LSLVVRHPRTICAPNETAMQGNGTLILIGIAVLLLTAPLLAAVISMAASAVLEMVPGVLVIWFVAAILRAMIARLFS